MIHHISIKTRYQLLKRLAILLNILGTLLLVSGVYSASEGSLYYLLEWTGMAILWWVSYELDYRVQEMLVQIYSKR